MRTVLAVVAVLASLAPAYAHGDAQWIQDGAFKNALGELCCGVRDCEQVPDDDIEITAAGYRIKSLNEFIPYDEATPSPNGKYWRCYWGGQRKCFFAPPPST